MEQIVVLVDRFTLHVDWYRNKANTTLFQFSISNNNELCVHVNGEVIYRLSESASQDAPRRGWYDSDQSESNISAHKIDGKWFAQKNMGSGVRLILGRDGSFHKWYGPDLHWDQICLYDDPETAKSEARRQARSQKPVPVNVDLERSRPDRPLV